MENFEIGIIGAGPAGYTAALHAASNGRSVVLFEKDEIGGVCLNRGCIPTKTILHSSEIFAQISKSENLGIVANDVQIDFSKVIEHKNQVIEKLRKGIELALKIAKVTVVNAEAKILSDKEILANDTTYICDKIICATGSSPKVLKGLEFNGEFLISSDDILNLKELPKNIEAEKCLLGSMFWSRESLQRGCEEADKDIFYLDSHGKIFDAIKSLYLNDTPVDITSVTTYLININKIGEVQVIRILELHLS